MEPVSGGLPLMAQAWRKDHGGFCWDDCCRHAEEGQSSAQTWLRCLSAFEAVTSQEQQSDRSAAQFSNAQVDMLRAILGIITARISRTHCTCMTSSRMALVHRSVAGSLTESNAPHSKRMSIACWFPDTPAQ